MKKNFIAIFYFIFFHIFFSSVFNLYADVYSKAKVLNIGSSEIKSGVVIQDVNLRILTGKFKGSIVKTNNYLWDEKNYNTCIKHGNTIVVRINETADSKIDSVLIKGYPRDRILFLFLLFFLIMVFAVCGKKGLIVIVSLTVTISSFVFLLLPMLKNGYPPVIACSLVAMFIALVMLVLILKFSRKFIASALSLSIGLMCSVLVSVIFINLTKISGLFIEGSRMILTATRSITDWTISDFQGIIIGSVIIAALGVTVDIIVDIVVGMSALYYTKKDITKNELMASGLKIGKDVLSGMLGSLILVFTASSIITIAVYTMLKIPVLRVINWEFFAVVILEALIGSITFVIVIPITVLVSGIIFINADFTDKKQNYTD
ncbi:MAG: YibE/F family protein [Elusimicrobiota bacterium]